MGTNFNYRVKVIPFFVDLSGQVQLVFGRKQDDNLTVISRKFTAGQMTVVESMPAAEVGERVVAEALRVKVEGLKPIRVVFSYEKDGVLFYVAKVKCIAEGGYQEVKPAQASGSVERPYSAMSIRSVECGSLKDELKFPNLQEFLDEAIDEITFLLSQPQD